MQSASKKSMVLAKNTEFSDVKKKSIFTIMKEQWLLIAMALPFMAWIFLFQYVPIWGWTMAFQNWRPRTGFFEQQWAGFEHFRVLFGHQQFWNAFRNTLGMGVLGLVAGFFATIGFALLINEIRFTRFKKIVQSISYLPHFVSWVIVANLVTTLLAPSGIINEMIRGMGGDTVNFMQEHDMFWGIVTMSEVWKSTGWGAIIYLAAMAGIDPGLYEAAEVDGANRWRKIWHITLPGIRPTIIVLLIMSVGNVVNIGFERQMLLGSPATRSVAHVLDWYALDFGINMLRFSYGTAVGIFRSVISITLVVIVNFIAKKSGESGIM